MSYWKYIYRPNDSFTETTKEFLYITWFFNVLRNTNPRAYVFFNCLENRKMFTPPYLIRNRWQVFSHDSIPTGIQECRKDIREREEEDNWFICLDACFLCQEFITLRREGKGERFINKPDRCFHSASPGDRMNSSLIEQSLIMKSRCWKEIFFLYVSYFYTFQ